MARQPIASRHDRRLERIVRLIRDARECLAQVHVPERAAIEAGALVSALVRAADAADEFASQARDYGPEELRED